MPSTIRSTEKFWYLQVKDGERGVHEPPPDWGPLFAFDPRIPPVEL